MKFQSSKYLQFYLTIIGLICISGCVDSRVKIEAEAAKAGFHNRKIETEFFNLFASIKINDKTKDKIVFYIEGDGHAWKYKNKLSDDPTPKNPVSLNFAIADSEPNVVYLARPCQYLERVQLEGCSSRYWSSHRYAEEVVDSMNQAITEIKIQSNTKNIELIGYSGGGVIAMLVAARRNDVSKIITVAANIDHESWSEWHGVSKLNGSLSPLDYLTELEGINQQHFWGEKDKVVPYKTQLLFIERYTDNPLFKYRIIPDFTHDCCWLEHWPDLLQQ